jgi:hypothetical protein
MAALSFVDIDQKPPSNKGKHDPLKKTPCQSIIGCDDTSIFFEEGTYSYLNGKEKKPVQELR